MRQPNQEWIREVPGPAMPRRGPAALAGVAGRWQSLFLVVMLLAALCISVALGADEATVSSVSVDDTRAVLEKWVETRRIIAQTRREWAASRETLNDQVAMIEREIGSTRARIAEIRKNIDEADTSRDALVAENEQLKATAAELKSRITDLERRTIALLPRLPDRFRHHVAELVARLPADPQTTTMSLSIRFQNVIGILNEANKFNRQVLVESEVRTLPDGTQVQVTVLYVGLGQAYYVGDNGAVAGIGTVGEEGWTWLPNNDIGGAVTQAVAILRNEQVADFVKLPISIK